MNGAKARYIRKLVYGKDMAPRFRKYKRSKTTGAIVADERRRRYQQIKKLYTRGKIKSI